MIIEIWESIKDNVGKRIRNPFLGTFTVVYIIHNWKLFFSLLNFDDGMTRQQKLDFITGYYVENSFWWNIAEVLLFTVIALLISYTFLAVGRYLINFNENKVNPWLSKITKGEIVTQDQYDKVVRQRKDMEKKYLTERDQKYELLDNITALETEINNIRIKITTDNSENDGQRFDPIKNEKILNELDVKSQEISTIKDLVEKSNDEIDAGLTMAVYDRIVRQNMGGTFEKLLNAQLNETTFERRELLSSPYDYFFRSDLFSMKYNSYFEKYNVNITTFGKEVKKLLIINNVI